MAAALLDHYRTGRPRKVAATRADGVAFEKEPTHNERFGITQAFLRDPDGNVVAEYLRAAVQEANQQPGPSRVVLTSCASCSSWGPPRTCARHGGSG